MIENWFATPIFFEYASEQEHAIIYNEVENAVKKYKTEEHLKNPWGDNITVTFSYTGENNVKADIPNLTTFAENCVRKYTAETGRQCDSVETQESWFNFYEKHSYQNWHDHYTGAVYDISAVYYHEIPEDGGILEFRDPSQVQGIATFPNNCNNMQYFPTIRYTPEVGKIILFPSYLHHCVEYVKKGSRTSIAFNFKTTWTD